jgi:two-component system NtrC family sensor kinase
MKLFEKLKYISLSSRVSILLGIIILITMGVFTIFSLFKQEDASIDSICDNSKQLSLTTERILRFSMLKNRRDELSMAVNNIVGKEGIIAVRILNHKGLIKFSSHPWEINKHISQTSPEGTETSQLCESCHKNKDNKLEFDIKNFDRYRIIKEDNLIYNCQPIYNAPSCYTEACHSTYEDSVNKDIKYLKTKLTNLQGHDSSQTILGFIEIEISTKRVNANLEKTRTQLILFTIIFALIASIITYFSIKHLIGKPIKNLVDGTKRVAEGNFKHEIPPGKAELKLLSESFNKMQKQLLTTQNQLIESEKLASIGKLAEEIANEINNPLTGIIIHSESLIEESNLDGSNKNDYEIIRHEALKIRESIRNILTFAGGNKPDLKISVIDDIINHAITVVKKFSNFQNIKIISEIPRMLPNAFIDPALLEQVFLNLLLISSEFMPAGGILNIAASFFDDKNEIEIVFSDTGKGIPENILQKIFNPVNSSDLENFEKTELSLAVCKEIIEMNKGILSITSNESGTSVTIILRA